MKILYWDTDFSLVEGKNQSITNQPTNKYKLFYCKSKKNAFLWSNEFWVTGSVQAEIEWPFLGNCVEKSPTSDNGCVKWPGRFLWNLTFYVSKNVPNFMP